MKIYREVGSLYIVNRKDAEGYERPVYEIEVDEAEPAVRCKDCKFYDPLDPNRPYDCWYMESIFGDDYCSRGEKR